MYNELIQLSLLGSDKIRVQRKCFIFLPLPSSILKESHVFPYIRKKEGDSFLNKTKYFLKPTLIFPNIVQEQTLLKKFSQLCTLTFEV